VPLGGVVEGVVGEEQVDGRAVPHDPGLAIVPHQRLDLGVVGGDTELDERRGHNRESLGADEHVESMSTVARGSA